MIGVLAYASVMTFGGCADTLILRPSTGPRKAGSATARIIESDGRRIEVFTARSAGGWGEPDAFVLEFTGNATRAEDIAQYVAARWKALDAEAWVMNYPGYGKSAGGAHMKSIPPAALATYDALAKVAAGRPIYVAGNSLGTTSALYVAANRPVAGLVLQNPPPLQKMIFAHYGWWNLWLLAGPVSWQVPGELNSLKNAPKVKAPAVIVTADSDGTVPPKYQRMVVNAYAGEKHVIEMHGGHNDSVSGEAEKKLLEEIDWLAKRR
jgi:uncharacterized protein